MKKHAPELYEDILKHVESHEILTSEQMKNYRKVVKQQKMSDSRVMEEMFADAFADMKTGRRIVEKIYAKIIRRRSKVFQVERGTEKYTSVALTNKQFKNFVERVEENIFNVKNDKGN